MILQALYEYYQRKSDLPSEGFEMKELKYIIVIKKDGAFVDLVSTIENKKGRKYLLPKGVPRSGSNSWRNTFLLWDHYGYVLNHPKNEDKKSIEMAKKQNQAFIEAIKKLPDVVKKDTGVNAVLSFYNSNQVDAVKKHPNWVECTKISGCNLTFRLDGENDLVPQSKIVTDYQCSILASSENNQEGNHENIERVCLITGDRAPIARLHTPTPIIGSKSNAKIVAFQKSSGFDSYGKEQAFNAPISVKAESAYSTALKYLLSSPTNKILISDSTVIFWAEKQDNESDKYNLEDNIVWCIIDSPKDDPDRGVRAVKGLYEAIHTGRLAGSENRFYVLGLSPNAARISVRFWKVGTVRDFAEKIKMHFDDLEISKADYESQYCTLNELLTSTSIETENRTRPNVIYFRGKRYDVPPNLASAVITSILDGSQYPLTLLQQCIRRIRAERHVNRSRAAILKAYINRYNRIHKPYEKEITMALDKTNTNPGYLLGRLFAVLENAQNAANNYKEPNAGIRDRFYGAFSSSPITVYPLLEKLYGHHLGKIDSKGFFQGLKGEIIDKLDVNNIPAHLSMEEQSRFAIGYYHQRQDFFTSKKNLNKPEQQTTASEEGDSK